MKEYKKCLINGSIYVSGRNDVKCNLIVYF